MFVLLICFTTTDGVGFEHIGSKGIEIISAVVSLASDNYPGEPPSPT